MNEILSSISDAQYLCLSVLVVLFLVQFLWLFKYVRISNHRHRFRLKNESDIPTVSVVVIIGDDVEWVYKELPYLLDQDHPNYEVVVVNDCGGSEVTNALDAASSHNERLRYTEIKKDNKFAHSRKIALVVGIKAARNNNIVFTTSNIRPTSNRWLSFMAKGFVGSQIVISYAGYESGKGFGSTLVRSSWLKTSVDYLSAAVKGHPYRGTMCNIGYTKELFFESMGFTHLSLSLGEDDLFIQRVAKRDNVAVIVNPHTTVRMPIGVEKGVLKWWYNNKCYYSYSYRYYPWRVKLNLFFEGFMKLLYFLAMGLGLTFPILTLCGVGYGFELVHPIEMLSIVVCLSTLREVFLLISVSLLCRRLGEKGFLLGYFWYDKINVLSSLFLNLSRRLRPPQGLWRF